MSARSGDMSKAWGFLLWRKRLAEVGNWRPGVKDVGSGVRPTAFYLLILVSCK